MPAQLASLDRETLQEPKTRIGSAWQAKQIVQWLVSDEDIRAERRAKMDGLLDGNQPWSRSTLKAKGMGDCPNFNLREAEGAMIAAKTPYYNLVFEVPRFAKIDLDLAELDPELNSEWGEIMSNRFHDVLEQWDGFDQITQLWQFQMCFYGLGPVFWPHPIDWRSDAITAGHVLVPIRTKANVDKLQLVVILHAFGTDKLMAYIKNESAAKKKGWDPTLVKKEIAKVDRSETAVSSGGHGSYAERFQSAYRAGDLFYAITQTEDVKVASLFVRSIGSGKVSHYIIGRDPEEDESETKFDNEKEEGYLFKDKDCYDSFAEVICPFFFDIGRDADWHSIKGLGPKIYDFCDVSNRMTMHMIRGAVIGSGIVLEAADANALQESQFALIGGSTVIAPGLKVAQTRIAESLNGAMGVKNLLGSILSSNTGNYRERIPPENQEPTYGQAKMNVQQQTALVGGDVTRVRNSLSRFYRETLRRLLSPKVSASTPGGKEALRFRELCEKDGMPKEALNFEHVLRVRANISIGYGSPQLQEMATEKLVSLTPAMDETSRNHAFRARVAAIPGVGQPGADLFFPSLKKQKMPEDHLWDAVMENNELRTMGGQVQVTSRQNHATHFKVHYADTMAHLQQMQQGKAQPHDVLIHLEEVGPHLKDHLDEMPRVDIAASLASGKHPQKESPEHKKMEKAWHQLAQVSDHLHKELERQNAKSAAEQQKNGNKQPQINPEHMTELLKLHGDMEIKRGNLEVKKGQLALKARKQQFDEHLADVGLAHEIRHSTRSLLLDSMRP